MFYKAKKHKKRASNVIFTRFINQIPKQARFKCNIPRFISHMQKQARFKCNIPRYLSHIPKQARLECAIPCAKP